MYYTISLLNFTFSMQMKHDGFSKYTTKSLATLRHIKTYKLANFCRLVINKALLNFATNTASSFSINFNCNYSVKIKPIKGIAGWKNFYILL